jgi:hypothetical protein
MTLLLKLAALGSILLMLMSAYPSVLNDFAFIAIFLYLMAIGGWIVLLMNARAAEKAVEPGLLADDEIGGGKSPISHWRWIIVSIAILILNFVLILNGIPRRVAFVLSWSTFQRQAATAPASEYKGEVPGRLLGVYYVDRYTADPRGGVYFRTHAGADGIGPDTMSYGFAYHPNSKGTPFGNAWYRDSHVVGDWYVLSASNDS